MIYTTSLPLAATYIYTTALIKTMSPMLFMTFASAPALTRSTMHTSELDSTAFITGRNEVVAKVIFLQVCVCPRGGCLPQCMLGCHTPPRWRTPPGWRTPLPPPPPPPGEADSSIRSTSGRYASYWNAYLLE